jgi:hypothetical protein
MDIYVPPQGEGQTRCPNWGSCTHREQPRVDMGAVCTVRDAEGSDKAIVCHANVLRAPSSTLYFWEVLHKWQHTWMWDNLQWVGDDDWLAMAIAEGTCLVVTDGLYMKDLYPNISLAAVVLECTKGRGRVWCLFPEASRVACSYRGELVGLMAIHLILLAINEVILGLTGLVHMYSNCLGALEKVKNLPPLRVPSRLAHLDVLKNILVNFSNLTFECLYSHVLVYQDDKLDYGNLSRPSQLNVNMDYNAKQALWNIQPTHPPSGQAFPLEPVCIFTELSKITLDMGQYVRFLAHCCLAQTRFYQLNILAPPEFDKVDWRWFIKHFMRYQVCFSMY